MSESNDKVLIRMRDVCGLTSITPRLLTHLVASNQFPRPISLATSKHGSLRWWKDEVLTWLKERPRISFNDLQAANVGHKRTK